MNITEIIAAMPIATDHGQRVPRAIIRDDGRVQFCKRDGAFVLSDNYHGQPGGEGSYALILRDITDSPNDYGYRWALQIVRRWRDTGSTLLHEERISAIDLGWDGICTQSDFMRLHAELIEMIESRDLAAEHRAAVREFLAPTPTEADRYWWVKWRQLMYTPRMADATRPPARHLTQSQAAELLGKSVQTYRNWEAGRFNADDNAVTVAKNLLADLPAQATTNK